MFHDWYNKDRGMCYPVCGMLLIGKNSPCSDGSGFPLLLYEWSFNIFPTPYNRKLYVLSVPLNKFFRTLAGTIVIMTSDT